ncbi:MAG: efflux RND transporter periplasmic adaptor subunit [Deltaproteobacteria bacterium]|nr:efflux RND transporter periplasmic adaptor subunit [Deltaproteobacteria bacterium]
MFQNKIFLIFIAAIFIFGCNGSKQQEAKNGTAEEHKKEEPGLILLRPEAVEKAGIKVEAVSLRPFKVEYAFSGNVSINETRLAHVGPRISGRAIEVYANLGDYVEKGHALAIIDSTEIGEAQSQYLKAKTTFEIAEKSYARAKIILEGKVISTGEFQRREGEYLSAKTELKAAEDRLHLLGMTEEEIASIGKGHTINSKVAIYAPLSGSVIERHLTLGEVVEPVKPLFSIADLSIVWVIADIPERDIPKIKKGQGVAVIVSAYPEKVFRGTISYISDLIDPGTRTVKVRIEVENSNWILKPGMFAAIKISAGGKDLLSIPVSAIQREGDKTIVFVAKGENSFEKRVVELGPPLDGFHEVIFGVKEGERVVTKGAFALKSEGLKGLMEGE